MTIIDFNELEEKILPNFKDGEKEMRSSAWTDNLNRMMRNTLALSAKD